MKNTLNVSELLKRLGVVGDSQGSADLLDQLRMSVLVADLSNLVPPVGVPCAAGRAFVNSTVSTFSGASLQCLSPGGLRIVALDGTNLNLDMAFWVSDSPAFAANIVVTQVANFCFGQTVQSIFRTHGSYAPVIRPAAHLEVNQNTNPLLAFLPKTWIGPGQFFNMETANPNADTELTIGWMEYPGMLNP